MTQQTAGTTEVIKELRVYIARHFDGVQKDYAKSIGVSSAFVSAVMKGKSLPSEVMLSHIGFSKNVEVKFYRTKEV